MRIGAQMYTLRDFTKTPEDFAQALRRVSELGFKGVQLSAVGCLDQMSAADVRGLLDACGLACVATHRPWDSLLNDTEREIALHKGWGCSYVAVAVPPPGVHEAELEGYRRWLHEARPLHARLAEEGIALGWHNHAMEFQRFSGGRPYDLLMEADWLPLEMDTCWVHAGGETVPKLISRLQGRLPIVHVKDRVVFGWEVTDGPVGEGNLDWPPILSGFQDAGTEWLLVEQDTCRRDPYDCLRSSLEFLRTSL